jgi:hypothetical protein
VGVRKGGVECDDIQCEGSMCLRRNGEEADQDFHQFIYVFTVEVVGISDYFHSHPDKAGLVCVDIPASSGKPMK